MPHTLLLMDRLGTIGDPVLFFASDASRFNTFRHFPIDGSAINIIRQT